MYVWIITRDCIDEGEAVGVMGPENTTYDKTEVCDKGKRFRMLDDDGELYYEGKCLCDEPGSEEEFGPLDDFGCPNAGCTEIQYLENGTWETL